MVCVCVYDVCICLYVHICVSQRSTMEGYCSPTLVFWIVYPTEPDAHWLLRLTGHWALGVHLSSPSPGIIDKSLLAFHECWGSGLRSSCSHSKHLSSEAISLPQVPLPASYYVAMLSSLISLSLNLPFRICMALIRAVLLECGICLIWQRSLVPCTEVLTSLKTRNICIWS